jgi:hypothetical protein
LPFRISEKYVMERARKISLDAFERFVGKGYEMKVEGEENLDVLDNFGVPVVMYFNHIAKDDPFLVSYLVHKRSPHRMENVIIPVSEEHVQYENYRSYATVVSTARKLWGVQMPEVVQSYRLRDDDGVDKELKGKALRLAREFFVLLDDKVAASEGYTQPLIILSPEGHRSGNGALQPAESGIGTVAEIMYKKLKRKKIAQAYFLPVGIIFDEYKDDRLYFNPLNKPVLNLIVGEAQDLESVIKGSNGIKEGIANRKEISHYLMWKLSGLLPGDMKGFYGPGVIENTFNDRYELRSGKGRVYVFDKVENTALAL